MPNAKDNAKLTGDTHLPDVGDENAMADDQAAPARRGRAGDGGGEIKDKDAETSDSYGDTRDTGGGKQ